MKVLHINCNYLDSMLHQTMVNELRRAGVDNDVFVPVYNLDSHIVKQPENYVKVSACFKKRDRFLFHYKQHKIYTTVKSLFDISHYDCLHAYTTFTDGFVTRRLAMEFGVPYVVAVRNTDVNTFFKYMVHLRNAGINVLKDAKAVFFLSVTYREHVLNTYVPEKLREEIRKKSYIVPNGIDNFWHQKKCLNRSYESIERRFQNKHIKVLYVGDIDKNKNITEICSAVSILERKGWKVEFDVVGRVVDNDVFAQINNSVTYHNRMPKENLIEYFRNADIFIMTSHTETFGLVYPEAMSQGLPVIYTRGQGFDKQFEDGEVGYACSDLDPEELVKKIQLCVENYERLSKAGLDGIEKYRWDRICEFYKQKYNEILGS